MFNMEYKRKTETLIDAMPKRMFHKTASVPFCGFFTYDRLTLEQAEQMPRVPLAEGTEWGKKWQYGWFFADIVIPQELDGARVLFAAELGECVVFVNGEVFGAFDQQHSHITLTKQAKAGEVFHVAMEVYAGHNGVKKNGLLVNPCNYQILIPEHPATEFPEDVMQKAVENASIGFLREEIFQLWIDMRVLYDLLNGLEQTSSRAASIVKALKRACDALDIEAPMSLFLEQVQVARAILKPALECKNGSSASTIVAIGNSHLDLEWVWTVGETRRKCARTLGNQLKLMEDYPEYRYLQSQAWILDTVKNEYPELYERVKKAHANGNLSVEGGSWVQFDANISSGESLIRQFLFGKRFYREEFGVESEIFWLPDSFGMSGGLPQILKGCGINYFMNAKIKWLYNDGDLFPYTTFWWQGIDGTEILTHLTEGYASALMPSEMIEKHQCNNEKEDVPYKLCAYGYGDGGGGATRVHLEILKRSADLEGMPRMQTMTPNQFFARIEKECDVKASYVGELYYAAHRGTYTSQAKTKLGNRRAEFALREAELWSALHGDASYKQTLDAAWKKVLFNQFHDVLPGSGIKEVHQRAEKSYGETIKAVNEITDQLLVTAPEQDSISVFNSLAWEREELIELPNGYVLKDGTTQRIGDRTVALVTAPSCGTRSYVLEKKTLHDSVPSDALILENRFLRAEFNQKGEMISLYDKEKQIEFLNAPSNVFRMYQDMPTFCDAWDIDSFYQSVEVTLEDATVMTEYSGELYSSLVITKRIGDSELKQRAILLANDRKVIFETEVDWHESHKLLKVDFNTNVHTHEILSETQFGYVARPTHRNRAFDADRFEVCQHKWSALCEGKRGVAILNDCKYGISANGGNLNLTLLKAGAAPDLNADKGHHTFRYAVMPFTEAFCESDVVRQSYEFNSPLQVKSGKTDFCSMIEISEKNVILETVKLAEDGSGDIVVRLYEAMNTYTPATIRFDFDIASACRTDLLENETEQLKIEDNAISLALRAFEIVTLKIKKK